MWLLKTHSHTSERRCHETDKERQVKRERKAAYPKRSKNANENHRHVTWSVGGGKRIDGKAKTQSSATTAARGGEAKLYDRKRDRIT